MMKRYLCIFSIALAAVGCGLIDEDLSGCPDEYEIEYEMRLVTNVKTEINTVLGLEADVHVARALKNHLKDIFSDFAHDVDLSFYDVNAPMPVLEHFSDIIDANQTSYTLHLPVREYMHLAVANIADNHLVGLDSESQCHTSRLLQVKPEGEQPIIDSHNTGLFTARLPMEIKEGIDQSFLVQLYMANCATALVVTNSKAPVINGLTACTTGFASSFNIADSTYVFESNPLVRAVEVPVEEGTESCYATVQFPSREPDPESKVVIETTEPFIAPNADDALWEWQVYVTTPDGSITRSRLGLSQPLRAGQLKIIRVRIDPDGSAVPEDTSVGVSVTLDWQDAGHHVIPL